MSIPPLTKDKRVQYVKLAKDYCEKTKARHSSIWGVGLEPQKSVKNLIKVHKQIAKASLLAGVGFPLAMYCRETGYSSHDFSCRTGFGAPWLEMIFHLEPVHPPFPLPPPGFKPRCVHLVQKMAIPLRKV